jgi:hypothetical protein
LETQKALAAQQETMRLRRMVYHALTLASLSPGTRSLGFSVRDPEADAAEAGADYKGRLRASPVVIEVDASGPAAAAGLRAGDEIISVDGVDTTNMPALLLMQMCLGEAASRSRMSVRRIARGAGNDGTWTETVVMERREGGELEQSWYEKAREMRMSQDARKQLEDVRMEVARLAGRAAAGEQELFSLGSAHSEVLQKRLAWARRNLMTQLSIDRLRAIALADSGRGLALVSPSVAVPLSPPSTRTLCAARAITPWEGEAGGGDGHLQSDWLGDVEAGGGMRAAVDEVTGRVRQLHPPPRTGGQSDRVEAIRGDSNQDRGERQDGGGGRGDYRTRRAQGMKDDEYYNARVALHDAPPSTHKLQVGVQQQVKGLWLADLNAASAYLLQSIWSLDPLPLSSRRFVRIVCGPSPLRAIFSASTNMTLKCTFESNLSCSYLHSNTQCVCW